MARLSLSTLAVGRRSTNRYGARRRARAVEGKQQEGPMNAGVRKRLDLAARARDFLRAHRTEEASEATALARLEELLALAKTLTAQQRLATMQREELRSE